MNIYTTLVRNSMPYLAKVLYQIKNIMQESDKIVIIENDSDDGITRNFLNDFKETCQNEVVIISEDLGSQKYKSVVSLERAQHMANCRNKYIDYIKESNLSPKYLIVFDSDLWDIPKKNFHTMFTNKEAVSSNGMFMAYGRNENTGQIQEYPLYYDTWAYQGLTDDTIYVSETYSKNLQIFPESETLIEVRSGFGGLGVYNWEFLDKNNIKYEPYKFGGHPAALCEHGGLNLNIRNNGGKVYINTKYCPEVRI